MAFGKAALGVQFHPEITYSLLVRWTSDLSYQDGLKGAQSRDAQLTGHMRHGVSVMDWLERFVADWLAAPASKAGTPKRRVSTVLQPSLASTVVPAAE